MSSDLDPGAHTDRLARGQRLCRSAWGARAAVRAQLQRAGFIGGVCETGPSRTACGTAPAQPAPAPRGCLGLTGLGAQSPSRSSIGCVSARLRAAGWSPGQLRRNALGQQGTQSLPGAGRRPQARGRRRSGRAARSRGLECQIRPRALWHTRRQQHHTHSQLAGVASLSGCPVPGARRLRARQRCWPSSACLRSRARLPPVTGLDAAAYSWPAWMGLGVLPRCSNPSTTTKACCRVNASGQ